MRFVSFRPSSVETARHERLPMCIRDLVAAMRERVGYHTISLRTAFDQRSYSCYTGAARNPPSIQPPA